MQKMMKINLKFVLWIGDKILGKMEEPFSGDCLFGDGHWKGPSQA